MRDYNIRIMASFLGRGIQSQIEVKCIKVQTEDLDCIDIGKVSEYYPLDKDARLELWITSEPTEAKTEDGDD